MLGTIVKGIGGFYYVKSDDGVIECKARGKFRFNELTPLVGDKVEIDVKNNKGVIEKIYPRTSELLRPNVSNVTQAFVLFSLKNPDLNFDLLNKFLVQCELNDLKIVICLNKIDLAEEIEIHQIESYLKKMGYEFELIQAKFEKGIEALKKRLKDNVTVVCGPSGAGKSTLINKLCGSEIMKTGDVSEKIKRGKHTTRHSELIQIEEGFLVDTPGFSTLELDKIPKEKIQLCFPEFREHTERCKFNGCMHYKEPSCGVKEAVKEQLIDSLRYESYIRLLEERIKYNEYS